MERLFHDDIIDVLARLSQIRMTIQEGPRQSPVIYDDSDLLLRLELVDKDIEKIMEIINDFNI